MSENTKTSAGTLTCIGVHGWNLLKQRTLFIQISLSCDRHHYTLGSSLSL